MKIFVDENIPLMTVKELRSKGFDVKDIRGTSEQGISDADLWQIVQKEKRLLITTDKGFSSHRNEAHHGILIIRLKQPSRLKIQTITSFIPFPEEFVTLPPIAPDSASSTFIPDVVWPAWMSTGTESSKYKTSSYHSGTWLVRLVLKYKLTFPLGR